MRRGESRYAGIATYLFPVRICRSYHLYPKVTMCAALNPSGTLLLLTFFDGVLM
jgi:hypothetical protein